jgi:glycosyltransferase involved in cell wall biosynthesis
MKLAIVSTHPIQYQAPWFRYLARQLEIKVFYLWDFGVTEQVDRGFGQAIQWDVPLLSGYPYEFVPNTSRYPGTHRPRGLRNPALKEQVAAYNPSAVLLMGYNYETFYRFLWEWGGNGAPLLLRGDSHRLALHDGLQQRARRTFIAQVFKRFAGFLYVGKANQHYYEYHGVPSQKLFFAPHAVDNEYFMTAGGEAKASALAWRRELNIPDENAVIMFAGKFEEQKRPLDLLTAFVGSRLRHATLLFVGAGEVEPTLRRSAARHSNIRFAPFQNQSLMPRTYAAADIVVLPSYSESWGLSVNEAMCVGRPVIVSEHVGCAQDLVSPRRNGLVFPAGDVASLASCLEEALSSRERLHEWGNESRRIIDNYSYRETTQGLMSALSHVCQC